MTPSFASAVLPAQAADGAADASLLMHLSGIEARRLGLQPGQLLRGVVKPGSSGLVLLVGGMTLPLPAEATVGAGGTIMVQALLMRGSWSLRPLAGGHGAPLSPSISTPSSGSGSDAPILPQSARASDRTPLSSPVPLPLQNSLASLESPMRSLSPAGRFITESATLPAARVAASVPASVLGMQRAPRGLRTAQGTEVFLPAFRPQEAGYPSPSERSLMPPAASWLRRLSTTGSLPLVVSGRQAQAERATPAAVSLRSADTTYQPVGIAPMPATPATTATPASVSQGSTESTYPPVRRAPSPAGFSRLMKLGGGAAPGVSADASKAQASKAGESKADGERLPGQWPSTPSMTAHSRAAFDGRVSPPTSSPPANRLPTESIGEPPVLGIDAVAVANRPSMPNPELSAVRMSDPVARDLGLRDGAIVQGAVKADGDGLKLLINGLLLPLPEGRGLVAGDTPTFRVVQSPEGLLLQPLRSPTTVRPPLPPVAPALTPPLAHNKLLSLLLHPAGLTALTQLLSSGLLEKARAAFNGSELSAALRPSMSRLNSASLRRAVAESGLWAEASMAEGKAPLEHDTKLLLSKLMSDPALDLTAREALGRGLEDIESAQLQAVQAQANHELLLNLVLPFSDANPVRLSFHRPAPSREQPNPPYTVNLHSRNDILGEIWLKTAITDSTQVDMTMWASRPEVAAAANKGSPTLAMELERAGLRMNSFVIYNSARQDEPAHFALPGAILDLLT